MDIFLLYLITKKEANYLASSCALVSLITVTLIVPGYCIVDSIFSLTSLAILWAPTSSTSSGLTITRSSLPAWTAKVLSIPLISFATFSSCSSLWI